MNVPILWLLAISMPFQVRRWSLRVVFCEPRVSSKRSALVFGLRPEEYASGQITMNTNSSLLTPPQLSYSLCPHLANELIDMVICERAQSTVRPSYTSGRSGAVGRVFQVVRKFSYDSCEARLFIYLNICRASMTYKVHTAPLLLCSTRAVSPPWASEFSAGRFL